MPILPKFNRRRALFVLTKIDVVPSDPFNPLTCAWD